MRLLKSRQDLIAVELRDPVEVEFPLDVPVVMEDAESGEVVEFSSGKAAADRALAAAETEKAAVCRKAQVDLIPVLCGGDVLKPLIGFFAERQRRMR